MNYLKKKQSGGLAIDAYNKRVQTALAPQDLTVIRNDGFLHIGDCIQVKSLLEGAKGAVLSVDLRDSDPRPGEESFTITGSVLYGEPNARNTFIIRKVTQTKSSKSTPVVQFDDDFLHYGQQIRLRLNPSVQGLTMDDTGEETDDALFLRSLPISPQNFSKVSKSQEVTASPNRTFSSVFRVMPANPAQREFLSGQKVPANAQVIIQHCATNAPICIRGVEYANEFGSEFEVCCAVVGDGGKSQVLHGLSGGNAFAAMPKKEAMHNIFQLVTGTREFSFDFSKDSFVLETAVLKIRSQMAKRGATGLRGIARAFKVMDRSADRKLSPPEFARALDYAKINLMPEEVSVIFKFFDKDGTGTIDLNELLVGLKGEMNEGRLRFVKMAFDIMDKDGSGVIDLNDVRNVYDVSFHPKFKSGQMTADEVLVEFLEVFEDAGKQVDGKVTFEEWVSYYTEISASIDDDDYFELMMRNAWHISGGEGQSANTSNRRVLVTHMDGRQTVEEIKNDLGIGATDTTAMMANLRAQGINAKSISLAD